AHKNHPNTTKKRGVDDATDDRETPADVFDPLNAEFGFTLDAASAHHNRKCDLYCTLGGLYACIDGRVAAVYEEDEVGWELPGVDRFSSPEGLWTVQSASTPPEAVLAGTQAHLRLGGRRYTARF